MLLKDKICLVTGAAKGIGRSIVESFAKQGAIVYANSRNNNSIDKWAHDLSLKYNTRIIPIYFDVTDYTETKNSVIKIKSNEKKIDVLVNNAGLVSYEMIPMVQIPKFKSMIEVNIIGTFYLLQLVSRIMTRKNSGSIINISSIVGDKGAKGQVSYATTKGAVIALTKSAAKELAPSKVRVNAVAPGMVGTERFNKVLNEKFKDNIDKIRMGRIADSHEIADLVVFLASDNSSYITGQVIGIDGSIEL